MNDDKIAMFKKINIDVFIIALKLLINLSFNIFLSSPFSFLHKSYSVVIATKFNRKNKFNLFLMLEIY